MEAKMQQAIDLSESIAQTTNKLGGVLVYAVNEINILIENHKTRAEKYEKEWAGTVLSEMTAQDSKRKETCLELALAHYRIALELDAIVGTVSKQVKEIL